MNKSIPWVVVFLIVSIVSGQPAPKFANASEIPVKEIRLPDIVAEADDISIINARTTVAVALSRTLSRSMPQNAHTMVLTAYTKDDEGMDGLGITASGKRVEEGVTIAAPPGIPFGTKLYIPALNHTYTVTDRGGDIKGNRLDLYISDKERALAFGTQTLDVVYEIN